MRGLIGIIAAFLLYATMPAAADPSAAGLAWSDLPPVPPPPGKDGQLGLGGPFVGTSSGAILVAGGANFPDGPPWHGGKKVWCDAVYVLPEPGAGPPQWLTGLEMRLPRPLAYGVSVTTEEGVVCIGGCDRETCYRDVFVLRWDSVTRKIETGPLPPLPRPLATMAGARAGDSIYVAGGQETARDPAATKNFWALDLSARGRPADFRWRELPPWPGPARIAAVAAAQENGGEPRFYLFSGRNVSPGAATELLTDAYEFSPRGGQWRRLADVAPAGETPRCVMAAPAAAVDGRILIFGGDDGGRFLRQERLERAVRAAADPQQREPLARLLAEWCDGHPGFGRDILAYNVDTNTWTKAGELPATSRLTTAAALWRSAIVIPTGEVRPGVRTPAVWQATTYQGSAKP